MVNAQTWLDNKYPLNKRNEIKELNINGYSKSDNEKLTGSLTLTGFNNLKFNWTYLLQ